MPTPHTWRTIHPLTGESVEVCEFARVPEPYTTMLNRQTGQLAERDGTITKLTAEVEGLRRDKVANHGWIEHHKRRANELEQQNLELNHRVEVDDKVYIEKLEAEIEQLQFRVRQEHDCFVGCQERMDEYIGKLRETERVVASQAAEIKRLKKQDGAEPKFLVGDTVGRYGFPIPFEVISIRRRPSAYDYSLRQNGSVSIVRDVSENSLHKV